MNRNKIDDNNPYAKVMLSSASKYLHSENLQSGHFVSHLGVLEIYFDQVQPDSNGADVYIDNIIGSVYLYIPKQWNVVNNIDLYLGSISYNNEQTELLKDAPRLNLSGKVILGNIKIEYI